MIENNQNTKITYLYDAKGNKLSKNVRKVATGNGATTDYLDGFQYRGNTLLFFPTSEGYVNNTVIATVNNYNYVFNYKDHLGNIRLSYSKDPTTNVLKILEENHYYPFGLKHTNYNSDLNAFRLATTSTTVQLKAAANPGPIDPVVEVLPYQYKYNSKEFQDELGLNVTAMDFRQYDNALGRFNSIDALSDIEHNYSTYSYSRNNPNIFTDPSGMSPDYHDGDDHDWNSGVVGFDENSRPPSFEGQAVNQNDMASGNPMGGDMKDVVVQNNFSEGYDKNGIIDLDRDGNDWRSSSDGGDRTHICTSGVLYSKPPIINLRLPDYVNLNGSIGIPGTGGLVGWNGSVSLSRFGNIYVSPLGFSVGKSIFANGSVSVSANWLNQNQAPSKSQLNNFLSGNGVSVGGGYWLGGGGTWSPGNGTATGVGIYTPQIGGSYNYTPDSLIFSTDLKW